MILHGSGAAGIVFSLIFMKPIAKKSSDDKLLSIGASQHIHKFVPFQTYKSECMDYHQIRCRRHTYGRLFGMIFYPVGRSIKHSGAMENIFNLLKMNALTPETGTAYKESINCKNRIERSQNDTGYT